MKENKLIITNAYILTMDDQNSIFKYGNIVISDGVIIDIFDNDKLCNYDDYEIFDANYNILMPGLINCHTHVPMTYFRGLADDLPLEEWLQNYIWPAEAKFLDHNFVYNASLHGCSEFIKSGITCFNDMYFWSEAIAQASLKVGIRAFLGEGILDFPSGGCNSLNEKFDYISFLLKKYKNEDLINFTIAPHSIYTCSEETLCKSLEYAKDNNLMIHIHISETKKEVENCLKENNLHPIQYLKKLNYLEHHIIAAHCAWLNDEELNDLRGRDFHVAVATDSNLKLGSGFLPLKKIFQNQINFAISTDGVASNNNLDLFQEMDTTAKVHKLLNNDVTFPNALQMLKAVTINAAKALQIDDQVGSIEVGKKADLIILDVNKIENQPINNPYSLLVYNMNASNVKDVFVNGTLIMKNRTLLNIDEYELIQKARNFERKIYGKDM